MKEAGINVVAYVGDAGSPTVYTIVAGQRSTQMQLQGASIDTSDKTTGGFATSLVGLLKGTVTMSGIVNWPDANGFARVQSAFLSRSTVQLKLVLNAAGNNYTGTFAITQCSINGTHDGATEYQVTFESADALTYA